MRQIGLALVLSIALASLAVEAQQATPSGTLSFENADIQTVIKHLGRLTGLTFLYDPEQVKGKITLLSSKSVLPAEALELLKSALALHGYSLLSRAEGMWIVRAVQVAHEAMTVKVVPLTYAPRLANTDQTAAGPSVSTTVLARVVAAETE